MTISWMVLPFSVVMSDSSKLTSVLGTREITYSNTQFDGEFPRAIYATDHNVVVAEEPSKQLDESYWEQVRPYRLSEREQGIYRMVDSIQQAPLYKNIYTTINTLLVGYYNTKYLGIGPYYKLASFNDLEGFRPRLACAPRPP